MEPKSPRAKYRWNLENVTRDHREKEKRVTPTQDFNGTMDELFWYVDVTHTHVSCIAGSKRSK